MRSSPRQASAFARCRSPTTISADWSSPMRWLRGKSVVFRVIFFGALILLCAGGIFALLVLTADHESPLRATENIGPAQSGDEYVARAADCVACHSVAGGKAFAGGLKMG